MILFLIGLITLRYVWFGSVWFGSVWFGLVRFGSVWFGLVRFGLVWVGLVLFGLVWFGLCCFVLFCFVLIWAGLDGLIRVAAWSSSVHSIFMPRTRGRLAFLEGNKLDPMRTTVPGRRKCMGMRVLSDRQLYWGPFKVFPAWFRGCDDVEVRRRLSAEHSLAWQMYAVTFGRLSQTGENRRQTELEQRVVGCTRTDSTIAPPPKKKKKNSDFLLTRTFHG